MDEKKTNDLSLTEQENQVIRIMRNIDYGEMRVVVQAGKPIRIEEVRKSIKL